MENNSTLKKLDFQNIPDPNWSHDYLFQSGPHRPHCFIRHFLKYIEVRTAQKKIQPAQNDFRVLQNFTLCILSVYPDYPLFPQLENSTVISEKIAKWIIDCDVFLKEKIRLQDQEIIPTELADQEDL